MNVITIHKRNVSFNVQSVQFASFWDLVIRGIWEEETFQIFDRFLDSEHDYLDIGAWIGPTVLWGAHKARHVYALEPDDVAFGELVVNLALNPSILAKVTPIRAALTDHSGTIRLYTSHHPGDSSASIIPIVSEHAYREVKGLTIDDLLTNYNLRSVNFIKMDIEAGEYFAIPAIRTYLQQYRPTLYLSLHPQFLLDEVNVRMRDGGSRHESGMTPDRPLELTKRLLEALEFYRYKYDVYGRPVDADSILNAYPLGQFVFSDERW